MCTVLIQVSGHESQMLLAVNTHYEQLWLPVMVSSLASSGCSQLSLAAQEVCIDAHLGLHGSTATCSAGVQ
jgi:hypothetical protein